MFAQQKKNRLIIVDSVFITYFYFYFFLKMLVYLGHLVKNLHLMLE